MKKKGYLKTIEVVLAAVITSIFLLYIMPQFTGSEDQNEGFEILKEIRSDEDLRGFVLTNIGCYNSTESNTLNTKIQEHLPESYSYVICIDDIYSDFVGDRLFIDSIYIASNLSIYKPRILRLYYWVD